MFFPVQSIDSERSTNSAHYRNLIGCTELIRKSNLELDSFQFSRVDSSLVRAYFHWID